jgi:hydrogenase/urease accessory protein HupE
MSRSYNTDRPGVWLLRARTCCAAVLVAFLGMSGLTTASSAHEVRPAYLELREDRPGEFSVMFKTPMRGELRLALAPEFTGRTEALTPITTHGTGDAAIQTWRLRALDPLRSQTVRIPGLAGTMTDALVRIEFADGTAWVQRLTPQQPAASVPQAQSSWIVAGMYLKLGVEHILLGFDHLLFVLALLIIARSTWLLVKTITAFTIAHSITLALATLGFVHVPAKPVEAIIALSIVFVATEIVYAYRGRQGLAQRAPWIVAFAFGLLHGLGFAGALSEVGLPPGHIPVALLFFNVGVEIGQLLFVGAVLAVIAICRPYRAKLPSWAKLAPPYAIGSAAMFWVFQRIAAF